MVQLSLEEKIYVFQNRIYILNKLCEMMVKLDVINNNPIIYEEASIDDAYFRLQNGVQDNRTFKEILTETDNLWKELKEQFIKIDIDSFTETN